jgi:hypothetical protein
MINHAIGASGVVSKECKIIVVQYGQTIMNLLLAELSTICNLICSGISWLIRLLLVVMSGMFKEVSFRMNFLMLFTLLL